MKLKYQIKSIKLPINLESMDPNTLLIETEKDKYLFDALRYDNIRKIKSIIRAEFKDNTNIKEIAAWRYDEIKTSLLRPGNKRDYIIEIFEIE